jgi:hypothetical protein
LVLEHFEGNHPVFVRYPDPSEKVLPIIDAVKRGQELLRSDGAEENSVALIRNAVHEHWELRHGSLGSSCHQRSRAARLNHHESHIPDWPIPRNYLARQLLRLPDVDLRIPLFQRLLYEHAGFVLVMADEAKRLDDVGLVDALPNDRDKLESTRH